MDVVVFCVRQARPNNSDKRVICGAGGMVRRLLRGHYREAQGWAEDVENHVCAEVILENASSALGVRLSIERYAPRVLALAGGRRNCR